MPNKKDLSFSIQLLKMNRKTHKDSVKRYTLSKKRREELHESFVKDMDKRRLQHQAYLDDIDLALSYLEPQNTTLSNLVRHELAKTAATIRCFRLKKRNLASNRVVNQRDYVGLETFQKYGLETWERYNQPESKYAPCMAEVYEKLEGKWKKVKHSDVLDFFY